jgi:glycine cleavage system transcriptional repressor
MPDRPGIVAGVSRILFENACNIEGVSQTILQTEFSGVFLVSVPRRLKPEDLLSRLRTGMEPFGLHVLLKPVEPASRPLPTPQSEPFVITTTGPDRFGLVAGMTEVMARFGVNITHLKAAFRGGADPHGNAMIYEVTVPVTVDHHAFHKALEQRARELGLDLTLQHRDIFEAIHRI